MGRRLLRGTVKFGVIAAVIGALVLVGKKLMGGLGPQPGSDDAPREWPSLVPDPATPTDAGEPVTSPPSSNGSSGKKADATSD